MAISQGVTTRPLTFAVESSVGKPGQMVALVLAVALEAIPSLTGSAYPGRRPCGWRLLLPTPGCPAEGSERALALARWALAWGPDTTLGDKRAAKVPKVTRLVLGWTLLAQRTPSCSAVCCITITSPEPLFLLCYFETGSHHVSSAGLKFTAIFPSQAHKW